MKTIKLLIFVAIASIAAAHGLPKEAESLKALWQEARDKAVRPIDEKYKAELEKLLSRKVQDSNLEEALAIKKEIESLSKPVVDEVTRNVESKIVGTIWERESGSHVMTFLEDGKFSSEDRWKSSNNVSHGRWVVTGPRTIQCINSQFAGIITEISFNPAFTKMDARNIEDPATKVSDSDRRFLGTSYAALKK